MKIVNIVKNNEAFYMKETFVNNNPVYIFSYRLATYQDFEKYNAYELRGLSFVKENNKYKRYIALNKFFNVNQNEGWMESNLKNKKIIQLENKFDGSMISFILVNDKVIAKTKMDLKSIQAVSVNKMLKENNKLYKFIYDCLKNNIMPIFEFVSPFNQIVLQYKKSDIILLQLRNMIDGSYIDFNTIDIPNFITKKENFELLNLEKILELKHTTEKIEGWVLTFEDGQMAKCKTDWYMNLHGLIGDNVLAENILIKTILNDNIDDILAELNKTSEKRKFIEKVINLINNYYDHKIKSIENLRCLYFDIFLENKKEFALTYNQDENFGIVMKSLKDKDIIPKLLKDYILRKTYKLNEAKRFLEKIKK